MTHYREPLHEKRRKDIHMTGETWKDKLIELVNTYDTSEETLQKNRMI